MGEVVLKELVDKSIHKHSCCNQDIDQPGHTKPLLAEPPLVKYLFIGAYHAGSLT